MNKEKKKPGPKPEMVTVECICSNVHLDNNIILRASRESTDDNWDDGDTAEVSRQTAEFLVKRKQVKIIS